MRDIRADPDGLIAAADQLGVTMTSAQADTLLEFRDLLLRWNRAFNLVSRRDTGRLLTRHLLDSMSVAPWLRGAVMDLGTGAGLPGVPLAIVRRELEFTLVDRNERKIRFVRQATRDLGLTNVTAWCGDVRVLRSPASFDTVVCRAVTGIAELWPLASPHLGAGGCLLVMHRSQSTAAADPVPDVVPGGRLQARRMLAIPGLAQPHELVVIERDTG